MLHVTILEFTNISAFYFGLVIKQNSNHTWEKTFNLPKIWIYIIFLKSDYKQDDLKIIISTP